uniref:hypothetical protein n=1 Tax=Gelidibacter sp. TaxID=2018083 RepID=UPI004049BFE8
MIKSVTLLKENNILPIKHVQRHDFQVDLIYDISADTVATLQITFNTPILYFRNHDYRWQGVDKHLISNWYAPKILMLENKRIIQANLHIGVWEVHPKNKYILLWHLNPKNASPLSEYDSKHVKHISQAVSTSGLKGSLSLLFPIYSGIEVSRSLIPFSAIACFTDHCDFDTLENLKLQRQFFKTYGLKITKGFFLNHFSKRPKTASFELHQDELTAWRDDGHELAYHSLSQSLRPLDVSLDAFLNFKPPFHDITTWIDHGFQPYNTSLYNNHKRLKKHYGSILKNNNIHAIWNYIDSGTAAYGVINQINPKQFTLYAYYNGIKHLGIKERTSKFIKNILFHYFNDPFSLQVYGRIAQFYKSNPNKRTLRGYLDFVGNLSKLVRLLFPILLYWKTKRHQVYPLAEFSPVTFSIDLNGHPFTMFQTIELLDFKNGLCPHNIDLLIEERGLFIAHTYFSVPLTYHQGKLFESDNHIDSTVENNFSYLSKKIADCDIWNPTVNELVSYLNKLSLIYFECNEQGDLLVRDDHQLVYRKVL